MLTSPPKWLLLSSIAATSIFVTLAASAQSQPPTSGAREQATRLLDEVVVTARRREESLQETPVAVSALSADALAEAGIATITDLQQIVPSLQFGESGSKTPAIFIRGIGQREGAAVLDPGVGVYLNGIFIPRQDSQLLDTVDTESIQVLRGPQGTLFGKNNTGGAILVNTRAPDYDDFDTQIFARVGNFGRKDARLSGNVPLIPGRMGLRYAISSTRLDGYLKNVEDGSMFGDEDRIAVTARLGWQITDELSADVFAYWSRQNERSTALTCIFQNPQANVAELNYPARPDFPDVCRRSEELAKDRKISVVTGNSVVRMDSSIVGLTLEWLPTDDLEIKSISSYSFQNNIERNDDQDGTPISIINNGTRAMNRTLAASGLPTPDEERYQFAQELQLNGMAMDGRLQYTVGAFGSLERIENNPFAQLIGPNGLAGIRPSTALGMSGAFLPGLGPILEPILGGLPLAPELLDELLVFPLTTFLGTRSNLDNRTWAVFAQGTYELTEDLQFTLGGRYTHEKRERDLTVFDVDFDAYAQQIGAVYLAPIGLYTPITVAQFDQLGESPPPLPIVQRGSADVRSETFTEFTPSATLSYIATPRVLDALRLDSLMTYVTYSKGFKAGGFEPRGDELVSFEPELVTNYELGVKMDALDSRLRLNAAVYHMDYEDIHVRVAEQGEVISDLLLFLSNAGQAKITGAELESTLLLGNWLFMGSAGYTDARYDDFMGQEVIPGQGEIMVDRSDEEFALVPKTTYGLAVQYQWLTDVGMFIPRVSWYYRNKLYTGIDFRSPEFRSSTIDSQSLFNARLSWLPSEDLRVTAFVDNLTDENYFSSGFAVSALLGAATLTQGRPRTYGLELEYRF